VATRREVLRSATAHLAAAAALLHGAPVNTLAARAADNTPAAGPLQLDGPAKAAVAQAFRKAAEKSKARIAACGIEKCHVSQVTGAHG
jgi:ABC-type sugar transport system substrate-binding protein